MRHKIRQHIRKRYKHRSIFNKNVTRRTAYRRRRHDHARTLLPPAKEPPHGNAPHGCRPDIYGKRYSLRGPAEKNIA